MKLSECARLVEMMMARFPKGSEISPASAQAYIEDLADLDGPALRDAIVSLSRKVTWFPSIAEVRREYAELIVDFPDPDELWIDVIKWARRTRFGRERLADVPPEVEHVVEFLGGWREMAQLRDMSTARAHVLRSHEAMKNRAIRSVQCKPRKQLQNSKNSGPTLLAGESPRRRPPR
jgi:hypothetical protein